MVLFLAAHGADITARSTIGQTALILAAENGTDTDSMRICRYLIHNGADVNAKTQGQTPLMEASGRKSAAALAMIDILLANGADVTAADARGKTALDYAESDGNRPAVVRLQSAVIRRQFRSRSGMAG